MVQVQERRQILIGVICLLIGFVFLVPYQMVGQLGVAALERPIPVRLAVLMLLGVAVFWVAPVVAIVFSSRELRVLESGAFEVRTLFGLRRTRYAPDAIESWEATRSGGQSSAGPPRRVKIRFSDGRFISFGRSARGFSELCSYLATSCTPRG